MMGLKQNESLKIKTSRKNSPCERMQIIDPVAVKSSTPVAIVM